jgi:hypothetical protein
VLIVDWIIEGLAMAVLFLPFAFLYPTCVCCESCTIGSDNFTRADSDDPGTDWTESSGDWDIVSNKISTSSANGLLLYDTPIPSDVGRVNVVVSSSTSGAQAKAIGAYVDTNNYWYARYTFGATDGTLTLWERSGGVETQRGLSATVGGGGTGSNINLSLCWTGDLIVARADEGGAVSIVSWASTDIGDAALGTGTTGGAVTFDDFVAEKNAENVSGCETCVGCSRIWYDTISTDTSADYNFVAGTWAWNAGGFFRCSSGPGFILANGELPGDYGKVIGTVSAQTGERVGVVGAYVDANNYIYSEVDNSLGFGTNRMFEVVGGTATELGSQAGAASLAITLCWDGTDAIFGNALFGFTSVSCTAAGRGFGFRSTGTADGVTDLEAWPYISGESGCECPTPT